ncbi:VOC family protein [Rhizobium sp. KAs_5_22]|uniref:VOC family protein n=1 Tax=Ciceribacter selenitireducens TaxID=448181 RepID=UPI00048D01B6|nr:VOC family protein [Ciceribacter selenitireducens]PPJ46697.1 VOC family protein [Rhizobium sp. KAs_5_22]
MSELNKPRGLDHLVLPVQSLEAARLRLTDLGFTVAPDARHPFGTENACVFFGDDTYLEPLAIASREECEAAAKAGNMFVARDQAFRFRNGPEGLSAIVVKTEDGEADHRRFVAEGFSGGPMLHFERMFKMADGSEVMGGFKLAFAADLRSPDFFLFACERVNPLPADRGALARHENGALGLSTVVLGEDNPSDFQYLLEEVFEQRAVEAHSFGLSLQSANVAIEVLTPAGLSGYFGLDTESGGRGLRGRLIVVKVADIGVTERLLAGKGIAFSRRGARLIVPHEAGQGVPFAFEEVS